MTTVSGRSYTKTRPRGFAPWKPHVKTQILLDQVQEVLVEYQDFLPLTVRQAFYRLVGAHHYEKTESGYSRLCECINRARRAGQRELLIEAGPPLYSTVVTMTRPDWLSSTRLPRMSPLLWWVLMASPQRLPALP